MKAFTRRLAWTSSLLGVLFILAIVVRLLLPGLIKTFINHEIAQSRTWSGHVSDVALGIFAGRIDLKQVHFERLPTHDLEASFPEAEVSISWRALLRKEIHINGVISSPKIMLKIKPPERESKKLTQKAEVAKQKVEQRWPLYVDQFEIRHLELTLKDESLEAFPAFKLYDFNVDAENIWNRPNKQEGPSNIKFSGSTSGNGHLSGDILLSAFSPSPIFKGKVELKDMDLRSLNSFFLKRADFDLREGWLSLFVEFASQHWKIDGYFKPLLSRVNFIDPPSKKASEGFWRKAWRGVLQFFSDVVKNPKTNEIAAKIPFSGRLDDPSLNSWSAFASTLRNAFIQSMEEGFDGRLKLHPQFPHPQPKKDASFRSN